MFRSHLKTAWRNIIKYKGYSLINVTGLAVGISCCILIFLYIQHELSYDDFHANASRVYRIAEEMTRTDGFFRRRASTGTPLAPLLESEYPGAEAAVRTVSWEAIVRWDQTSFRERRILFADPDFFEVFTFPLVQGDAATVLDRPFSVVLTEETARRYFGTGDAIGQTLVLDNWFELTVTGIAQAPPTNTHFQFDFIASFESLNLSIRDWSGHWDSGVETYVLLRSGTDREELGAGLETIADRHRNQDDGITVSYWLHPLQDIHLTWETSPARLYILGSVGLFILLLAVVNYVNLAMAQALRRTVEFSLRKVVGGTQWQLARQYITESMLNVVPAAILGWGLAESALPTFSHLAGIRLVIDAPGNASLIMVILIMIGLIAVLAGMFPLIYFASLHEATVFKGTTTSSASASRLRSGLVVFQMVIATVLIVATIVTHNQLAFLQQSDMGFDRTGLLAIQLDDPEWSRKLNTYRVLKSALAAIPGVRSVAAASNLPGESNCHGLTFRAEGSQELKSLPVIWVDHEYVRTLGIEITEGRDFSRDRSGDAGGAFLLNRGACKELGIGIGDTELSAFADPTGQSQPWYRGPVIGVTDEFNFRNLRYLAQPVVLTVDARRCNYLLVRIDSTDAAAVTAALEKAWKEVVPFSPFEYLFIDQHIESQYRVEGKTAAIALYACLLAIVEASLGLVGLASFMARERTREIGIRRVLGATVGNVVLMLTRKFILFLIVANAVAWPVAYLLIRWWLQEFPYRVNAGATVFLGAGAVSLLVVLISVGFQAVRAALANPVQAIRYE